MLRYPTITDGPSIWDVARESGNLDVNPPYAYLMACRNFADTSVVAEASGELAGFIIAYKPSPIPETVFVWQVAVRPTARGAGIGSRMLDRVIETAGPDVRYLDTNVTPSNDASWNLFKGLARRLGTQWEEKPCFPNELFPDDAHEEERLLRIGPFSACSRRKERPWK